MLVELYSIWNEHLRQMNNSNNYNEKTPKITQPIHSAAYQVGSKAQEFEKAEMEIILSRKSIEPAHTEWFIPILFAWKKDRSLRLHIHYWKLNAVSKRDFYLIHLIDECINSTGEVAVSTALDANSFH